MESVASIAYVAVFSISNYYPTFSYNVPTFLFSSEFCRRYFTVVSMLQHASPCKAVTIYYHLKRSIVSLATNAIASIFSVPLNACLFTKQLINDLL